MTLLPLLLALPLSAELTNVRLSTPVVTWPSQGFAYPYVTRSYTFGTATAGSTLTVNGRPVTMSADGAFLAMTDLSTGPFSLRYESTLEGQTVSTVVVVNVKPQLGTSGPDEELDPAFLEPRADLEVMPGDDIVVQAKGPPGMEGSFRIKRLAWKLPMVEREGPIRGIYQGHYRVQPGDRGEKLFIRMKFRDHGTGRKLSLEPQALVTVRDPSRRRMAVTLATSTVVRTSFGGYDLFLPPGVLLEETGRARGQVRVRVGESRDGWVDADKIRVLADGTPPSQAQLGRDLTVEVTTGASRLGIPLSARVPFEVKHDVSPYRLWVTFYGAEHRLDRMWHKAADPVFKEVRWTQGEKQVTLEVTTKLDQGWGYDASYDDKGRFVLEVRHPPVIDPANPLRGRRIVVDAGHAPDRGAIGPRGSEEQHVNLALALRLRDALEKEGASVFMIRDTAKGVPLAERPLLGWQARGDVYVSVHVNAVGVADDPLSRPLGYMTLYYHRQSRVLAETMHRAYGKNWPELPDSGIAWGDLNVCRITQMPAILTESLYLILPDQEALLLSPAGQEKFAKTMADGLRDFFRAASKPSL